MDVDGTWYTAGACKSSEPHTCLIGVQGRKPGLDDFVKNKKETHFGLHLDMYRSISFKLEMMIDITV